MSVRSIEAEVSIKSGVQAECTIGREVVVEVHDDVNLESLTVTANGQYAPADGVDGFSDVTVQVPERIPVTESLSVTQNGLYEPDTGIDGYDRVVVDVPPTIPDIEPLTVTANGVYTAEGDGFNPVTVNVEAPKDPNVIEGEFIGTETGTLTINTGCEGNGFPKAIVIQPVSGVMQSNDGFFDLNPYALNTFLGVKANGNTPTYDGTGIDNALRTAYTYRSTNRSYASNQVAQYPYDANPAVKGNCVRINNKNTITVWIDTITDSGTSRNYFAVGVRYKYQIFY